MNSDLIEESALQRFFGAVDGRGATELQRLAVLLEAHEGHLADATGPGADAQDPAPLVVDDGVRPVRIEGPGQFVLPAPARIDNRANPMLVVQFGVEVAAVVGSVGRQLPGP